MSNGIRSLSDDDVHQIGSLLENLEGSHFDFLQLELGDVKLTLGRGLPPQLSNAAVPAVPAIAPAATAPKSEPVKSEPVTVEPAKSVPAEPGTLAITAPLLGRFYARPEPGALPFVSLGSAVTDATTVGLIEVMKTFNAVSAGVCGVVDEICVQDAQFVEFGQALFRVRPAGA